MSDSDGEPIRRTASTSRREINRIASDSPGLDREPNGSATSIAPGAPYRHVRSACCQRHCRPRHGCPHPKEFETQIFYVKAIAQASLAPRREPQSNQKPALLQTQRKRPLERLRIVARCSFVEHDAAASILFQGRLLKHCFERLKHRNLIFRGNENKCVFATMRRNRGLRPNPQHTTRTSWTRRVDKPFKKSWMRRVGVTKPKHHKICPIAKFFPRSGYLPNACNGGACDDRSVEASSIDSGSKTFGNV